MTLKEVGITHALRRGVDDEKTLAMLHRGPVGVTHLGSALARALCLLTARRPVDQAALGGLSRPGARPGDRAPSRRLGCSSWPPAKPSMPPALTTQALSDGGLLGLRDLELRRNPSRAET